MTHERVRLGISACLLGEPVRFDGGHKRDPFLVESLGQFVDWVPVCPEVESGLDAPRESMRLVQVDGRIRLLTNKTAQDHTTRMRGYARRRVEELADDELCGYPGGAIHPDALESAGGRVFLQRYRCRPFPFR